MKQAPVLHFPLFPYQMYMNEKNLKNNQLPNIEVESIQNMNNVTPIVGITIYFLVWFHVIDPRG